MDLELFTTQELIDELLRRRTFLGIVVHSLEELKDTDWRGERTCRVHFNGNLDSSQASRLLEVVAERMDRHADTE